MAALGTSRSAPRRLVDRSGAAARFRFPVCLRLSLHIRPRKISCPIHYQLLTRPTMGRRAHKKTSNPGASTSLLGQRRVVHGISVAKLEEVIVQEAVVKLDIPPGLVQILDVK